MLGNLDNVLTDTFSLLSNIQQDATADQLKSAASLLKKHNESLKEFAKSAMDKASTEVANKIQFRIQNLQNMAKNPSSALQQQVTAVFYKELRTTRERIRKILEHIRKDQDKIKGTYKTKTQ